MEAYKILRADYLDVVFDSRNKLYGSYQLRKHANKRSLMALLMVVTGITALSLTFWLSGIRSQQVIATTRQHPPLVFANTDILPVDLPKPAQPLPKTKADNLPKPVAKTIQHTVPKIVPDNLVAQKDELKSLRDIKDALAGPVNNMGQPGGTDMATTEKIPEQTGNGMDVQQPLTNTTDNSKAIQTPSVMPQYPGGMDALRKYLSENIRYPRAASDANIQGRVMVEFVVNEKGNIEEAHILKGLGGGCDREALRVVNNMPRWIPGKANGRNVKVYYKLPITFVLQGNN
jgi:protein TonB